MIEGSVALEFYSDKYNAQLSHYHLTEDQLNYTASPLEAIKKCKKDSERCPIIILYRGEPAGFLVLHGWEGVKDYSENRAALLLRAYSIDGAYQGKGIATQSLLLLDSFVKKNFPDKKEIILAVNHNNFIAQHVYKKSGFTDTGKRAIGRKGEMFILHKHLV
ncbi:GNAT family N-acetyltransferase [Sporolactobacillus pectinivorans]|uniref:GNAT family N-acetyltransferase n=1 Tax=Sporolactobacillus pectinivorans TaxID=1591408 RepID=UPI000C25C867|nr:GNAT family N-acetyltransferase [Sporolactobacillus pectinivorans]